jgi:hypothetical protein
MISGTSLIPVSDFPYSECNLGHVLARLFASKEAAVRHFPKSCLGAALVVATFNLVDTPSAAALTMKECSAKYRAAQAGGTTGGLSWQAFRNANCSASGYLPAGAVAQSKGGASFPTAIAPKYASESPGKARMHTCLDQYKANKPNNGNGGLRWIAKGGGYYSECNERLKR